MIGAAISRTRPLMAKYRYDVAPANKLWWKLKPEDGQIIRSLSPYESQAVVPFLRDIPKRAYEKASDSLGYIIVTAFIVIGTATATDAADAAMDRAHRY